MDHSAALDRLWQALDRPAPGPGALDTLDAESLESLREAFENAQANQRAAMQAAIDHAMGYLPALLRKPVIKILRGGKPA